MPDLSSPRSIEAAPPAEAPGRAFDAEELGRRLGRLAELGGLPLAVYATRPGEDMGLLRPADDGLWFLVPLAPLPRLIDETHPTTRPCRATVLDVVADVLAGADPGTAECPSSDWLLTGFPVAAFEGERRRVLAVAVAARPNPRRGLGAEVLAGRYDLNADAVRAFRKRRPEKIERARMAAIHDEIEAVCRDASARATFQLGAAASGQAPRTGRIRTVTGTMAATGSDLQPLLNAMVLEAVWIVDGDGLVRQANSASRTWFGGEIVGHACDGICGTPRPPCRICPLRRGPSGESHVGTVLRHEMPLSGRTADVTVYPLHFEDEPHPGALLVARDVTARKRLERSLQDQTQRLAMSRSELQLILDCMGEGLIVTDAEGRITQSNPIARFLFDATPADLEGGSLLELLPAGPRLREAWEDLLAGRTDRAQEEVRVTGVRVADLLVTVARMTEGDGAPGGFVVTMKDITRLKELDRLRDDFISNVSHELRTPLATVRGFARTIRSEPEMAPEQRSEFLGLIDREAERLGHLIEDMLTMARLDGERSRARPEPVDLTSHVGELAAFFRKACQEREIALDVDVPGHAVLVDADPGLLLQLSHNLLGNAIKFTPPEGRVRVSVEEDAGAVTLRFADTGPGIAEEEQAHVFEKFYRAPGTARAVPGTGLGLAIVKRIVDAHGWSIGLRSGAGRGTEVWVAMPRPAAPPAEPEAAP